MRLCVALHVCESVVIWILHKERIHTKPALPYGPHKTFNVHVENICMIKIVLSAMMAPIS